MIRIGYSQDRNAAILETAPTTLAFILTFAKIAANEHPDDPNSDQILRLCTEAEDQLIGKMSPKS